jgi:signal peptidase II
VRQGYVLDFVDIYVGDWHFWAFNVADAAVSIGAVLVFVDLLLLRSHVSDPV